MGRIIYSYLPMIWIYLPSQLALEKHNQEKTNKQTNKKHTFAHLVNFSENWNFLALLFVHSRDLHVLRAQRIIDFLILITHKTTGSENLITWYLLKQSSKVWRHHFANVSIRTFKPHHEIYTAAVRTWTKFQIVSINESEDREVWSFTKSHY